MTHYASRVRRQFARRSRRCRLRRAANAPKTAAPTELAHSGTAPAPHGPPDAARRSVARVLLGAGVAAVGAGLLAIGSSLSAGSAGVVGANMGVNRGAGDRADLTAHNSPKLVRSPVDANNVVVANRIDTPQFSCALHVSFDAGATWAESPLPFPEGEEAPPRCFAPDAAFAADGTLHLVFTTLIGLGNRPNAVWIVSSGDGGRTFSTPRPVLGPLAFQTALVADPRAPGRLYLSWLQAAEVVTLGFANPGNPINVARSNDGGRTWSEPVRVSPSSRQRVIAPTTAVGADGALHVLYLDLGDDRLDYSGAHEGKGGDPYAGRWELVAARSRDQGRTWQDSVVDRRLVPAERVVALVPPRPALAVDDARGTLYAGFFDARLGDADVWLWTSDDGGATFGPRRRVNDTTRGEGTAQYLPALAVAPSGRVDVAYYDRRADRRNRRNHVSFQSSFDRGRTFTASLRVSSAWFDSGVGFGSERGLPDLGSRLGVVSADTRALVVWTDTRAGTEDSNKQDLARAAVAVPTPASSLRSPLRWAGIGAVAGGAAILLSALVRLPLTPWAGGRRRRRRTSVGEEPGSAGGWFVSRTRHRSRGPRARTGDVPELVERRGLQGGEAGMLHQEGDREAGKGLVRVVHGEQGDLAVDDQQLDG